MLTSAKNAILDAGGMFDGCRDLQTVIINEKTTKIGNSSFGRRLNYDTNCRYLKEVIIPEGVTEIGDVAFINCSALEKVNIPESVIEIAQEAFRRCVSLKSITIPDGMVKISVSTFDGCKQLNDIQIGENITIINDYAFRDAPISECKIYAVEPPVLKNGPLSSSSIDKETAKLYIPKGSLAAYQESDWATYFGNIIEMEE